MCIAPVQRDGCLLAGLGQMSQEIDIHPLLEDLFSPEGRAHQLHDFSLWVMCEPLNSQHVECVCMPLISLHVGCAHAP